MIQIQKQMGLIFYIFTYYNVHVNLFPLKILQSAPTLRHVKNARQLHLTKGYQRLRVHVMIVTVDRNGGASVGVYIVMKRNSLRQIIVQVVKLLKMSYLSIECCINPKNIYAHTKPKNTFPLSFLFLG